MDLQIPGDWNFAELLQQESNMNNEFMMEYTQQSPPKVQMNPLLRRHKGVVISQ